jgi:hypothetical protein
LLQEVKEQVSLDIKKLQNEANEHLRKQHGQKAKLATECPHKDRPHYSSGRCQNCYLACYYQKRKAKQMAKQKEKEAEITEKTQKSTNIESAS